MSTDFEQTLREQLLSTVPPQGIDPDPAYVLTAGNRALRRQNVRRATTSVAAIAVVAVAATTWWQSGAVRTAPLPGTSNTATSLPNPIQTIQSAGYGDASGTRFVDGTFDTRSRILRLSVRDETKTLAQLEPVTVPAEVTVPVVVFAPGTDYVVTMMPSDASDVLVDNAGLARWTGQVATIASDVDIYFSLLTGLTTKNPVEYVSWTALGGRRLSTAGDSVALTTVSLANGRTASVYVLPKAGEFGVVTKDGNVSMRTAEAGSDLPALYTGRGVDADPTETDFMAAVLLPKGATGVSAEYAPGFTPRTPLIVTPLDSGEQVAFADLGVYPKELRALRAIRWTDSQGVSHTERL